MDKAGALGLDELVMGAQGRDRSAFTALVSPCLQRWLRIASAILGNEPDALDALQGTLVSVWSMLPQLRDRARFEGWSTRILVNESRRVLRRRARTRLHEVSLDAHDTTWNPVDRETPDLVGETESKLALERAFEHLDVDARAILVLHHLENRPVSAIAEALGIPNGTVKSRLFTAREALARAVAKETR